MSWNWNLPPGCGKLPGEEEYPDWPLKCQKCGAFVKNEPDTRRMEEWEDFEYDSGADDIRRVVRTESVWCHTCGRCRSLTPTSYYR